MNLFFLARFSYIVADAHLLDEIIITPQIEVIYVIEIQNLSEFLLCLEDVFVDHTMSLGFLYSLTQVSFEDIVFTILVSKLVFNEIHVANTMFTPFILVKFISFAYSPLRPNFVESWIQLISYSLLKGIWVIAKRIWVWRFHTTQVFGVVGGPVTMNIKAFSKSQNRYLSQMLKSSVHLPGVQ